MEVTSFYDIADDFIAAAHEAVWCNVATVDRQGRPRSRMLHPIWEVVDGLPVGWIATNPGSLKAKHIESNPYVSLTYAAKPFQPIYVDCRANWVLDIAAKQRLWDWFGSAPAPLGYDLSPFFGTADSATYGVLKLVPWRLELGDMLGTTRVWRS